jgi:hypothetical protein
MDSLFPPPAIGGFEAIASAISALAYLAVGVAALGTAPGDARVRLFFVLSLTSIAPYLTPVLFWMRGADAQFTKPLTLLLFLSVIVGGIALFHFLQVFPWRRPWIRAHGSWLAAAYVVCPLVAIGMMLAAPDRLDESTPAFALSILVVGMPLLVLVGLVLPFAGLLSIYASWLDAKRLGIRNAERPALAMLVSQLAGGILAIIIVPLLHIILPSSPWTTIASALLFAFGLLMPIAFAMAIWVDGVLQIDAEESPIPHP